MLSMSPQSTIFISLIIIILLPILPAYILFAALPSRADVTGPFHGLEIKLGGAFAGYFLLVVLVIADLPRIRSVIEPETSQVWTVEGRLFDQSGNGLPVGPCDIQFKPSAYDLDTNWFRVTFTTHLTPTALIQFPNISLAHQGFPNEMIPLAPPDKGDTTEVRRDETAHSIVLNPIILKKPTAAYAPTGVLPPPIAPEAYEKFISSPRGASQ